MPTKPQHRFGAFRVDNSKDLDRSLPLCPKCGAPEMHPTENKLLVRAFKVDNWSQCLVCAGYYDPKTLVETPERFDARKGWFSV